MPNSKDIVIDIWKSHRNYLGQHSVELDFPNPAEMLARCFCPGPFFYYVIDSPTLTIDHVSDSIEKILGVEPSTVGITQLLERVHPDDKAFQLRCEDAVAYFLKNCITADQVVNYKICYCVRLRTHDNNYRLFLWQTITLKTMPDGALLKVFGVQTDISHITNTNNYKLSLIGLEGEPSFTEIDVLGAPAFENFKPYSFTISDNEFTNRELEILRLLSTGHSTAEIAQALNISVETANTHRKNMIRKSGAKNSIDLVMSCVKKGYL